MEALKKLGRIIMLVGIIIAVVGGAAIGTAIQNLVLNPLYSLYYTLDLILGILIIVIAILVVIAGDIVEDEERSVIPDKIGLPISLIGGMMAGIGGLIIGKAFALELLPILNLVIGVLFCVMGAVIAYTGKFVTDL